jgi:hypothetical protein
VCVRRGEVCGFHRIRQREIARSADKARGSIHFQDDQFLVTSLKLSLITEQYTMGGELRFSLFFCLVTWWRGLGWWVCGCGTGCGQEICQSARQSYDKRKHLIMFSQREPVQSCDQSESINTKLVTSWSDLELNLEFPFLACCLTCRDKDEKLENVKEKGGSFGSFSN